MNTEGWLNPAPELKMAAHYYKQTESRDNGRFESYQSLCGLDICGQNMDLDISEMPMLPICKTCLQHYKQQAGG